jgi:dienelactone hydrolase
MGSAPAVPGSQLANPLGPPESPDSLSAPYYRPDLRDRSSQPSFRSLDKDSGGVPLFWILGLLGGGCLIVLVAVLIGLTLVEGRASNRDAEFDGRNLLEARTGFQTTLTKLQNDQIPVPLPSDGSFEIVQYESPAGMLSAYLSQPDNPKAKHPAIIWKFGGFSNRIGTNAWDRQPKNNDQSASAFRQRGVVMMYPSLRGGNGNAGHLEGFYGEVDDILAAAKFLAKQEFVDPNRIYLGGHSTGGTLVLLCAAASDRFRAVFSFGPVDDVSHYGPEALPFNSQDQNELKLRNPAQWLHAIHTPTFVFEGAYGNSDSLQAMKQVNRNNNLHFYLIPDKGHFDVLGPMTELLANKVIGDSAGHCNIEINDDEIQAALSK